MYRDDYIAHAIYERARAWTRASFFVAKLMTVGMLPEELEGKLWESGS